MAVPISGKKNARIGFGLKGRVCAAQGIALGNCVIPASGLKGRDAAILKGTRLASIQDALHFSIKVPGRFPGLLTHGPSGRQ